MMDNNNLGGRFAAGLLNENPLFRLGLGICPALAVTTHAATGLAMGVATACALVCTSVVAALFGRFTNETGRLPVYLMIAACFATVADLILKANYPDLSASLGIFVPLIAVSCLLLSRAEYAGDHGFGATIGDALGMGVGYVIAMTVLGIVRELIGHGTVFGANVLPAACSPMVMMALPAGGFMALGLLMGICNAVLGKKDEKEGTPV